MTGRILLGLSVLEGEYIATSRASARIKLRPDSAQLYDAAERYRINVSVPILATPLFSTGRPVLRNRRIRRRSGESAVAAKR